MTVSLPESLPGPQTPMGVNKEQFALKGPQERQLPIQFTESPRSFPKYPEPGVFFFSVYTTPSPLH